MHSAFFLKGKFEPYPVNDQAERMGTVTYDKQHCNVALKCQLFKKKRGEMGKVSTEEHIKLSLHWLSAEYYIMFKVLVLS